MQWRECVIETEPAGIEPLSNLLVNCALPGFVVEDERDFEEFLTEGTKYWDYVDEELLREKRGICRLKFYISDNEKGFSDLEAVRAALSALERDFRAELRLEDGALEEEDWANAWKKYYKPMKIGKKLLVVPEWEQVENPENRVVFLNNPGMAFGSGSHASTRMCMEALEERVAGGELVYDLGCGSGILSIIAALLGAREVRGIDIDSNAAEISEKNAARNHVEGRCRFEAGDLITEERLLAHLAAEPAEIVVANIVADVIIALAPRVRAVLKKGGLFISSGIIEERADEVEAALREEGFAPVEKKTLDGWCCFVVRG